MHCGLRLWTAVDAVNASGHPPGCGAGGARPFVDRQAFHRVMWLEDGVGTRICVREMRNHYTVVPHPDPDTGLSKHGDPVFLHCWAFFGTIVFAVPTQ